MMGTNKSHVDSRKMARAPSDPVHRLLDAEVSNAGLSAAQTGQPVTEGDIAGLPEPVQRYLRFMGVVGRSRDWSIRAKFEGRFRTRPTGRWMPAQAWQYNSAVDVARIFVMRARIVGVLPVVARDTYVRGHGRMLVRVLDRFTVVDAGGPEFDHSELVIHVNDAIMLAPSMLLTPTTCWSSVDDDSFDVAFTDQGQTVTARVLVDHRGAPVDFRADRYATLPQGLVRASWRTPVQRWEFTGGRPLPGPASALYELPDGHYCYVEGRFVPGSVTYNVPPGT